MDQVPAEKGEAIFDATVVDMPPGSYKENFLRDLTEIARQDAERWVDQGTFERMLESNSDVQISVILFKKKLAGFAAYRFTEHPYSARGLRAIQLLDLVIDEQVIRDRRGTGQELLRHIGARYFRPGDTVALFAYVPDMEKRVQSFLGSLPFQFVRSPRPISDQRGGTAHLWTHWMPGYQNVLRAVALPPKERKPYKPYDGSLRPRWTIVRDYGEIVAMESVSFKSSSAPRSYSPWDLETHRKFRYGTPTTFSFVVDVSWKVAGDIYYTMASTHIHVNRIIANLNRWNEIAWALIQNPAQKLSKAVRSELFLEIHVEDKASQAYFEELGFVPLMRLEGFYSGDTRPGGAELAPLSVVDSEDAEMEALWSQLVDGTAEPGSRDAILYSLTYEQVQAGLEEASPSPGARRLLSALKNASLTPQGVLVIGPNGPISLIQLARLHRRRPELVKHILVVLGPAAEQARQEYPQLSGQLFSDAINMLPMLLSMPEAERTAVLATMAFVNYLNALVDGVINIEQVSLTDIRLIFTFLGVPEAILAEATDEALIEVFEHLIKA